MNTRSVAGPLLALALAATAAGAQRPPGQVPAQWPLAPRGELHVENGDGARLTVRAWDRQTVSALMEVESGCTADLLPSGDSLRLHLRVVVAGRGVLQTCDSRLALRVPRGVALEVHASGDLTLGGLSGEVRGGTAAGRIDVEGLTGRVELVTEEGDVRVARSTARGTVRSMRGKALADNPTGLRASLGDEAARAPAAGRSAARGAAP